MLFEDQLNLHIKAEKEKIDKIIEERKQIIDKLTHETFNINHYLAVCTGLAVSNAEEILKLKLDLLEVLKEVLLIRSEIGTGSLPKLGLSYSNKLTVSENTTARLKDIEDKIDNLLNRIS